jgi:hypothetical protein
MQLMSTNFNGIYDDEYNMNAAFDANSHHTTIIVTLANKNNRIEHIKHV